jgi:energy-coupling factor transport system ATP-binding protein
MESALELNIRTLTFLDREEAVLKDINFSVKKGECLVLTGGSAAGKSLLLHTMTGAAMKYEGGVLDGSVYLMGKNINEIPLSAVCEELGYMFQEPQNQIVSVTVGEEVAFGLSNMGCSREEIAKRSREALSFTGLTGLEQRKTMSLSGGQAQRLVFAGVLALKAPILILDQPAAELDRKGKLELYALIQKIHREGVTVILAADNGVDITAFADRVIEMEEGTIKREYKGTDHIPFRRHETQRIPDIQKKETVLSVTDVSYAYQGNVIGCEDISFQVNRGDFTAIMGVNGSGKTTLLKLMEGLLFPDCGKITVFGQEMTKKTAFSLRSKIGFLFQNPDLQIFADTVKEEVAFALRNRPLNEAEKKTKIKTLLDQVGLAAYENCHPQRLSRSQRQKLAAASALVHDPEIVIADEPTAGLNEEDGRLIMDLLASFRAKGGTVILVSHDPEWVLSYADHIMLLDSHHLVGQYVQADFTDIATLLLNGGIQDEAI